MEYNWNDHIIKNSNIDSDMKKILSAESKGDIFLDDPSLYDVHAPSYFEFKKNYFLQKKLFQLAIPEVFDKTINLYKDFPFEFNIFYKFAEETLEPNQIISLARDFFDYLDDEEISEAISDLFKHKRDKIKIQRQSQNIHLSKNIRGRCITGNDIFISLFLKETVEDFVTFIHELGHYLTSYLYKDKLSIIIDTYTKEVDGIFFELLAIRFLGEKLEEIEVSLCLQANEVIYFLNNIWRLKIKDLIYRQISIFPNIDRINEKLKKLSSTIQMTDEEYIDIVKHSLYKNISDMNSFLIALDLYDISTTDLKTALKLYKRILTSEDESLITICENNNVSYLFDNFKTLHKYVDQALELPKHLKK